MVMVGAREIQCASSMRTRRHGSTTLILLLSLSLCFGSSFAFCGRSLLSISPTSKCQSSSIIASNYHQGQRRQLHNKERCIPTRHGHGAIAYPIGISSLDHQDNTDWAEIITQSPTQDHIDHDHVTTQDKLALGGGIAVVISLLLGLLKLSSTGSWRYFLAGGVCAAVSHAIPTPIDVVKTRKQVDATLADKNVIEVCRDIYKNEGMGALWAGLGPTVWGYLFEGGVKFGVYEALKPVIAKSLARASSATSLAILNSQLLAFILCGTVSGLAASFMVCPMEALRIRMVADPEFCRGGMVAYGLKILKREGVAGLGKGMSPMIMKQVPYTLTKNVSFDFLTKFFYSTMRTRGMKITAGTAFTVPLISAAIASVMSCISSQPGDMVLSVVNAHEGDRRPMDMLRDIVQSDRGIGGLFVGFKTRLLHVGVIVTIQLLVYDYVKRLVGIAATGM